MADSDRPAETLAKARFGYGTNKLESDVTVGTTAIALVGNNPNRIQLQVYNNGQSTIYVSSKPSVALNKGTPVGPNGGSMVLLIAEDGMDVAYNYYALAPAAGNSVHIVETVIQR